MAKRYIITATQFRKIKGMDFQQLNDWITSFYNAAYTAGVEAVSGADVTDAIEAIASIKGIGPKRKAQIEKVLADLKEK